MWIVLFVSALCFHLAVSICPGNWLTVNITGNPSQTCFRIFTPNQGLSFDAAATRCQNQGGYLARDTSQNVHNALRPNLVASARVNPGNFWIGLTDNNTNNGPWVWVGGPNLGTYTAWGNSNVNKTPNRRDCVYVTVSNNNFKWQVTANCGQTFSFICQRDFNTPLPVSTTVRPLNCPNGWSGFPAQHWCIKLFTTPATWTNARMQCSQNQADLVTINNTALNSFVSSLINVDKSVYWIGLNDRTIEGTFSWLDSKNKANYTNWGDGMPNNNGGNENCVVVDGNKNNKWDDLGCNIPNRYICQRVPWSGFPPFNTASTPSNQNCGFGWEDVTGSDTCISFNINVLSWLDARVQCQNRGGDLASVANLQEQTYLSARAVSYGANMFWIGANDRVNENGWQWTDGTPFAFLNWGDKQPDDSQNSDCTVMVQKTGKWDDVPCQSRNGYICKKKGRVTQPSLITTTTPPAHLPPGSFFGCPRGWDNYRGSCYKVVQLSTGVDWSTANAQCTSASMQGALAAIIDGDENKFVFSIIPKDYHGYVWIGLQDQLQENTFTWVDNTPVQYTNWDNGEPNNINNEDCVTMKGDNGRWNDANCALLVNVFICKKSKSIQPQAGSVEEQGCTNGSIGHGAQCYTFIAAGKTFYDAQKDCKARSQNLGNLATVDSGHLQAFLTAELFTLRGFAYWIGLQQNNDVYKWQDPVPVSFTYWDQSHTGNERGTCVAMLMSGLWANYPCNHPNISYICESPRTGFTTPTTRPTVTRTLPCPTNWTGYGGLCYKVFSVNISNSLSWGDARDFCARQATGGSLVTVNDNNTQSWLISNLVTPANASGHFWIGLNDRDSESGYVWVDSSPYLYTNWGTGEPNDQQNREDCVEWVLPQNYWNDDYCYVSKNWICQVPRGSVITTPKPAPTGAYSSQCGNSSWIQFGSYCYFVSDPDLSTATWFDARSICFNLGAQLASIGGEDENGFITSLISKSPVFSFWIGLNDLDQDTYGWSDNSPVSYVNWALNEPNDNYGGERCIEIRSTGSWNDNQCQAQFGYVCKKLPGNAVVTPYVTPPIQGGCPRNFVSLPSLGFCYFVDGLNNSTRKNFTDALNACEQMVHKSTLASIHSSLEEKYILTLTADVRTPVWIGLNDRRVNNHFEWVDNLAVTYTKWGPGQPDENVKDPNPLARRDCVDIEVRRNVGSWNDRSCSTRQAYICESRKGTSFPTVAPNTTGCNAGYQRFHSSCYKYYRDYDTWSVAQSICKGDGGNLVTINSGVEQAFVEILTGHVNDSLQFWLGLQYDQTSTSFHWADGWSVRFTNWGHSEPNIAGGQSCVTHMVDGQWQVVNCTARHPFVCEINFGSPPPSRPYNNFGRCPGRFSWFPLGGNCYHIESNSPKSWAAANALCTSMGASLASIHSDTEAKTLTNFIGNLGKDVWIGLFKGQGSGFSWYDGTEVEYLNWGYGEPSDPESTLHQDCVKIQSNDGSWADTNCFDQNAYICKKAQVYSNSTGSTVSPQRTVSPRRTVSPGKTVSPGQTVSPRKTVAPVSGATPNQQAETGNNDSGLSGGSVAGIVIGTLILVALVAVGVFLGFRYIRGQGLPQISKQQLTSSESGFDNATYSSGGGVKVNFTEA